MSPTHTTPPTPTVPTPASTVSAASATPVRHRATGAHPAGRGATRAVVTALPTRGPDARHVAPAEHAGGQLARVVTLLPSPTADPDGGEEGSLVAEYGLLAVVAATVAGVLITWASSGALTGFFDALLSNARGLVGA